MTEYLLVMWLCVCILGIKVIWLILGSCGSMDASYGEEMHKNMKGVLRICLNMIFSVKRDIILTNLGVVPENGIKW